MAARPARLELRADPNASAHPLRGRAEPPVRQHLRARCRRREGRTRHRHLHGDLGAVGVRRSSSTSSGKRSTRHRSQTSRSAVAPPNHAGSSSAEVHSVVSEPLTDRHNQFEQFSSGSDALDVWLQRHARHAQSMRTARTSSGMPGTISWSPTSASPPCHGPPPIVLSSSPRHGSPWCGGFQAATLIL